MKESETHHAAEFYSTLGATIGSTCAPRRAGTYVATNSAKDSGNRLPPEARKSGELAAVDCFTPLLEKNLFHFRAESPQKSKGSKRRSAR